MPVEIRQLNIHSTIASPCGERDLEEDRETDGNTPDPSTEAQAISRSTFHDLLRQARER